MSAKVKVQGLKEFDQFLKVLPAQPLRRAVRGSLNAVGKVLLKSIKENLKPYKHSGNLIKSTVKFDNKGERDPNKVSVIIGFLKGSGGGNHAHLLEFGTGPRVTSSGKSTGSMPATRFFTKALDEDRVKRENLLKKELKVRFEKQVDKLMRKKGVKR